MRNKEQVSNMFLLSEVKISFSLGYILHSARVNSSKIISIININVFYVNMSLIRKSQAVRNSNRL